MHLSTNDEWTLPDSFLISYEAIDQELYVGGVFIRLFLKSPKFNLRAPKKFLEAALSRVMAESERIIVPIEGASAAR